MIKKKKQESRGWKVRGGKRHHTYQWSKWEGVGGSERKWEGMGGREKEWEGVGGSGREDKQEILLKQKVVLDTHFIWKRMLYCALTGWTTRYYTNQRMRKGITERTSVRSWRAVQERTMRMRDQWVRDNDLPLTRYGKCTERATHLFPYPWSFLVLSQCYWLCWQMRKVGWNSGAYVSEDDEGAE